MENYSQLKKDRINLREAIPLAKPFTVLFEPTSICNFKCTCCFQSNPEFSSYRQKGRMSFQNFKTIADDLAGWKGPKIKVVRIIGFGEPLINPDTPQMIRYLKDIAIAERLEITTNASLLTPDISRKLIDSGLDYIRCSIYSVDQNEHKTLTQCGIKIDTIRQNITELKMLRDSLGASRPFIYVKMLESENQAENSLFLEQYSSIADEAALEKRHKWLSSSSTETKIRKVCPQPFKMLSILCNGDVILCDPDWQKNTCVGNALSENISAIWNGPKVKEFWKMQLENRRSENKSCRNCSFLVDEYAIDDIDGVSPEILNQEGKP